jgi:hypothetical protein
MSSTFTPRPIHWVEVVPPPETKMWPFLVKSQPAGNVPGAAVVPLLLPLAVALPVAALLPVPPLETAPLAAVLPLPLDEDPDGLPPCGAWAPMLGEPEQPHRTASHGAADPPRASLASLAEPFIHAPHALEQ